MRGSRRPSRASEIGAGRVLACLAAAAFVLIAVMSAAHAQSPTPTPTPTPTPSPTPSPTPTVINGAVTSGVALTNLGSNFLERLGNQAGNGFNRLQRTNPGGGGASESTEAPRYRTWFEAYGNSTRNGAVGDFVGGAEDGGERISSTSRLPGELKRGEAVEVGRFEMQGTDFRQR